MAHPESTRTAVLTRYRQTGNLSQSASAAGINRVTFYRWLASDPVFAARFVEVQSELRAIRLQRATAERDERARVRVERIAAARPIWAASLAKARERKRVLLEARRRRSATAYRNAFR
ncbi:MAG: hypothetical protein LC104_03200 [Bacteroidales bacterium]|nr:hypothetical protein [Bacteroidales bacterium]